MAHSDTFYRKPNARELKTARQLAAAVRTHNWTAAQVDLINRPEPSQVWSMVARYLEHRVYSHGESARDTATEWFAKVEAEIEFLVELGFDPPVKHWSTRTLLYLESLCETGEYDNRATVAARMMVRSSEPS